MPVVGCQLSVVGVDCLLSVPVVPVCRWCQLVVSVGGASWWLSVSGVSSVNPVNLK